MALNLRSLLGLSLLLALSDLALAGGDVVFERSSGDGTIELTNVPSGAGDYRPLVRATAPSSVPLTPPPVVATQIPAVAAATGDVSSSPVPVQENATDASGEQRRLPPSEGAVGAKLRSLYTGAHAAHEAQGGQGR